MSTTVAVRCSPAGFAHFIGNVQNAVHRGTPPAKISPAVVRRGG